jgi:hypothetical protein
LALIAPEAFAAVVAALRGRWYSAHRESALVATRAAQAAGALLQIAVARNSEPAAAFGALRLSNGAWAWLVSVQLACVALSRMRFSAFAPAQLLCAIAAACVAPPPPPGVAAVLHIARVVALTLGAPALLAFGLDTRSRQAFAVSALRPSPGKAKRKGASPQPEAAG